MYKARTVVLGLGTGFARAAQLARSYTTGLTLGTVFARALIFGRARTAALSLGVAGFARIPFDVLNRMTGGGGGTTIIKRVMNIVFDD